MQAGYQPHDQQCYVFNLLRFINADDAVRGCYHCAFVDALNDRLRRRCNENLVIEQSQSGF